MKFRIASFLLLLALLAGSAQPAWAEVKLHGLFTNNMVLQREAPIRVWGTADNGEKVTVTLEDPAAETATAETTAADGRWQVELPARPASNQPAVLKVSGSNTIELSNVVVGDVWICSGQSNMRWGVKQSANPEAVIASANLPQLRLFTVPRQGSDVQQDDVQGAWSVSSSETIPDFSAVAFHFGRELNQKLDVPIGLINTCVGGTNAQEWASDEKLRSVPELAQYVGTPKASKLYNAMIHPLVKFPVRGAIWYQGENNAVLGEGPLYLTLFPTMIENWREQWQQPAEKFPFLFVQLAPYKKIVSEPVESDWAELRESQRLTAQTVPHTAMAVITDVGDENDVHPRQKEPVGHRLALAARALVYGEDVPYSGPEYESLTVEGNQAILKFTHVGDGLAVQGDKLVGFTLAGEDRKFHNAEARIEGDTVVVVSPAVETPVAVRYGWADYPVVNLANQHGLLASPFRTDTFERPKAE